MVHDAQFSGKVIAITGAASGIGLETAVLLAARGATLALADVQKQPLHLLQARLQSDFQTEVSVTELDVRDVEGVEAWVADTVRRFGNLHGAANIAGVVPDGLGNQNLPAQDLADWDRVLAINLTGLMYCLRAQLRHISDHGSIVTASSIYGHLGSATSSAYAASKHGVLGLTRCAAKEGGPRGVRVNAICPGRIVTPMLESAEARKGVRVEPGMPDYPPIAMRRDGQPKEVAQVIAFLLSDEASYVSGADISVDGAWRC